MKDAVYSKFQGRANIIQCKPSILNTYKTWPQIYGMSTVKHTLPHFKDFGGCFSGGLVLLWGTVHVMIVFHIPSLMSQITQVVQIGLQTRTFHPNKINFLTLQINAYSMDKSLLCNKFLCITHEVKTSSGPIIEGVGLE